MTSAQPSFGHNLWDKIPTIEHYTQEGLDNLSKLQDFLKRRSQAEIKYAKELQSISEAFRAESSKKKKKEEKTAFDGISTSQRAWDTLIDQTDALSKVHMNYSQFFENELSNNIKNYVKTYENDKKARFNDVKHLKAELRKVSDNLAKVKKNYETMCKEADSAQSIAEKAKNDMNVTKAYEDKVREEAAMKSKKAEEADEEYQKVLRETNEKQNQHYRQELPNVINQIQTLEETRVEFYKSIIFKYSGKTLSYIPEISQSFQKIMDVANAIDKSQDSQTFINQHDTKTSVPPPVPYENFWEKLNMKRRRKPEDEEFDNLSADKAYKKAGVKLKEVAKELEEADNKRSGIETLAEAYLAQPELADATAISNVNNQLDEIETKIDTLRLRKFRYETIIATAEARDPPVMPQLYADEKPPPASQILKNQILGSKISNALSQGSLSDAKAKTGSKFSLFGGGSKKESVVDLKGKFRVLYDFVASGETELSCQAGDVVTVAEKTDSGWVHVKDSNGKEGFVPQNYIEEII